MEILKHVMKEELLKIKELDPKTELSNLDFKEVFSIKGTHGIEVAKDIAAFANTKGGHIIFGVTNDFVWIGLDDKSDAKIDESQIGQLCEKYIDGYVEITYSIHEIDEKEFLMLYIAPSNAIHPFKIVGQYERKLRNGRTRSEVVFREGDVYCRRGSRSVKADHLFYKQKKQNFSVVHNLPSPPFHDFIGRRDQLEKTHELLIHENTRLLQVNGIGGIGKTSLVYHYCDLLTKNELEHEFEFVIWMSGKRTIFTPDGEKKVKSFIASYRDVISEVSYFLGDEKKEIEEITELAGYVDELIQNHKILLVVDNMETLIEENLITFLFNLPRNVKAILTTRESISNFQMSTITLNGFKNDDEFEEFIEREYKRRKDESFFTKYKDHLPAIYEYTQGMPLAIQLITNQLALDVDVNYIMEKLESGKTYESLLSFCFRGSIEKLDYIQKSIIYILSIPETDEFFSIEELKYISSFSDDEIAQGLQRLSVLSLCYKERTFDDKAGYASPHLTKIYVRQFDFENKHEIILQYEKYLKERSQIALTDEQYIIKSRANNHEQRIAALKVKDIMSIHYFDGYDTAIKLLDEKISEVPDFAYLHYLKGIIEKQSSFYQSPDEARKSFSRATELDPLLIEAWIEWGYLEQGVKQWQRSYQYFEQALNIDKNSPRANHGYARTLSMLSFRKNDQKSAKQAIEHFKKGYYINPTENQQKHANAINAHAYAKHLQNNLADLENAFKVCEQGLTYQPKNDRLSTLRGELRKLLAEGQTKETIRTSNKTSSSFKTSKTHEKSRRFDQKNDYKIREEKNRQKQATVFESVPEDILKKLKEITKQ
ncbi:ATP-binding protein [Bacillus sp. FJAT-42315]|uniref:ATP-binding protein n=1 Tax=Bacillus sp. FJAT-42315 TaxID=2014077 RepID=UPI000C23E409|nr:ATP-binding protein [Bacillus sp. FJAT-42315]